MLSMEIALFRQSNSRAYVTDASRDLGCDPWSIHQPCPPYQTGALASAGGAIYEGVPYCDMSKFLTLGAKCKTLEFRFFVIRLYYEKLGRMLKPIVPKFRPDLSVRLRDITEKQVPAKLKPIVCQLQHFRRRLGRHRSRGRSPIKGQNIIVSRSRSKKMFHVMHHSWPEFSANFSLLHTPYKQTPSPAQLAPDIGVSWPYCKPIKTIITTNLN